MKRGFLLSLIIAVFVLSGCQLQSTSNPKYVFLFIGDGMGVSQVYAAEVYLASIDGNHGTGSLSTTNFPIQSYMTTYSADDLITCSSASGTAMSTGYKTNNGVLCKDTSLTINYETVAEKAKKAGYKVGILSSVAIDHATPASFYAHQDSRRMYYEISMELPESNFNYFGGGGFHYPTGRDSTMPNAFENAVKLGYTIADTKEEIELLKNGDDKILAMNPELYPYGEYYWEIDKKEGSVSLADFTRKGIEVLDNPGGFFMMVEGGKIDWACHANDGASMIHETLAFDEAISEALKFYKNHPDETLIIVTADHETGGVVLGNGNDVKLELLSNQKISGQEFVRKASKLKEEKPTISFKEVLQIVEEDFGLGNIEKGLALTKEEKEFLYEGYKNSFLANNKENADSDYLDEKEGTTLPDRVVYLINKKAGISWASYDHSASPVPVRALGVGQVNFEASIDNTDISKIISKLMNL